MKVKDLILEMTGIEIGPDVEHIPYGPALEAALSREVIIQDNCDDVSLSITSIKYDQEIDKVIIEVE